METLQSKDQLKEFIKESITDGIVEIVSSQFSRAIVENENKKWNFVFSKEEMELAIKNYSIWFNSDSNVIELTDRERNKIFSMKFYDSTL